ncbi:MAG: PP2C family protein-serine/threonine phosphatase, partial [Vicinamibacteria bacterium]
GLGWALVGLLVAAGIAFTRETAGLADFGPILSISLLFAEVVGFTALSSARLIFPFFDRLPFTVRIALEALTLFSGTVFGSLLIATGFPLFSLAKLRTVAMVILINATLSVAVGIALHTYDRMRRQLQHSFLALREKEAMERQVEIAREVQRELFPRSIPHIPGLEMAGVCLPTFGIGGDYYDFLPLTEDRVGLVIADVSGKGIPAALLMSGLQSSVRGLVLPDIPAAEMNRRLNEVLYRSTSPARSATLFFGVYDARERALTYSNAGHNPPLQLSATGTRRLSSGGIPLGVLGGVVYEQETRVIAPGDLLALYTDGVTEAINSSEDEYGIERLRDHAADP